MDFLGAPYPITKNPKGLLYTQSGLNQIKSDLLVLLLTNPGERVMLPDFGTPLRSLLFEQNDTVINQKAVDMISKAIRLWEPRVTIESIDVQNNIPDAALNPDDLRQDTGNILYIKIRFFDPDNIKEVQELVLEMPLGGGNS